MELVESDTLDRADQGPQTGGWVSADGSLVALSDLDNSNGDIGVDWMTPQLQDANASLAVGGYYCGRISTDGAGEFSELVLDGGGRGVITVLEERRGQTGQAVVAYSVNPRGVLSLAWGSVQLTGSVSADGDVLIMAQLESSRRGLAVCLRSNNGNSLANVAGSYIGSWINLRPSTAVTELLVTNAGNTSEAVYRDSFGNGNYALGADILLSFWDGRLETRDNHGAIAAGGKAMFIVYTDPDKYPTLVYYTRKQG